MKKIAFIISFLFLSITLFSQNSRLVILHTNDLHSNLTGFSPELEYSPCVTENDSTMGGFSRIAGIIKKEKEVNKDHVLVLDAGDFLMGTFFHVIEKETGFQLPLMKKMGYDVLALGNHEFDFGPNVFADIVNKSLENGEIPLLTLSNVEFSKKEPGDEKFKKLYDKNIIKEYHILERDGLKIGIFGLIGKDADDVAPGKTPLGFDNYIKSAKKTVKKLKTEENVDIIICLSHSGLTKDKNGNWSGEDVELAKKITDIDIIISGHTHSYTFEPILVENTIIVQSGSQGKNIGRLEIVYKDKKISQFAFQILNVDDFTVKGDCSIHKEIASQIQIIDDKILKPMGFGYYLPVLETDFEMYIHQNDDLDDSNLGPFLADAIHYYVNNHSQTKTDISLIAHGVIRDNFKIGKEGIQIASDIFRIVSLGDGEDGIPGYPLAQVFLTGKELKSMFEMLLIAPKLSESNHCYYSGVKVYYDTDKGFLRKIRKIEINGEEIDYSRKNDKLYGLVANSYMLEFVGMIKSMTFGLVSVKPKDIDGNKITDNRTTWINFAKNQNEFIEGKEWMAVLKYIETFEDKTGNGIPNIPDKYKNSIRRTIDITKN